MAPFVVEEIELYPLKPSQGLVAWASFVLNRSLYVAGIGVHLRPDGRYRLVYPERVLPNGKRISLFHPINRQAGDLFEQAVSGKLEGLSGA